MIEVYTPKQWLSAFGGCPKLVIDDDGYIYDASDYYKVMGGSHIGRIDYARGHIYGKGYADMLTSPIGYIEKKGDVTKVYDEVPSLMVSPILYIEGDKVYTPDEYTRILGGRPTAYLKREGKDDVGQAHSDAPSSVQPGGSGSSGGSDGAGLGALGGLALKLGGILLAMYCVIGGVSLAMPIWLSVTLGILLLAVLAYKAFLAPKNDKTQRYKIAFFAVVIWFGIAGLIISRAFIR